MGNSVSKTKVFSVNLRNKINQTQSNRDDRQEPSSPHRTLVESDLSSALKQMDLPSVLQNHGFFSNKTKAKKKPSPVHRQYRQHASVKNTTLSRKKAKHKKKVVITKSIIGRPTNFKHLTCTRNDMDNEEGNNESSTMAAQMIALAALIKPLPDMDPEKTLTPPIIPPRHSSYSNHFYIQHIGLSLPSPPSPPSCSSSSSSSSCSSAVMQRNIPSVSTSKSKKKSKSNKNYPSIKKGKKTNIKYASIGKGSIARKRVQHDKMPRQKQKNTESEQAVNSLDL
ncbi:hypothetical protein MAM1_0133d06207 [Mucor ambiguus]|uniref:Uncharacterized protein n=1 Tax=Mucor ambiguus TaxID=91626 RepID=A0A0C9MHD6_9FUNG|nr:hypothetical protein MAM1_0133d06207 [Mucor ambiguus]